MTQWQPQPKLMMQKNPSQHILLYQGFTELINDAQIIEGEAVVKISWHPSPNINFKFIYYDEDKFDWDNQDNLQLKLTEFSSEHRLKVRVHKSTSWGGNKKVQLLGYITEPFVQGSKNDLHSVVFHFTNFWWFNISNRFEFYEDEQENEIEIHREGWLDFEGHFIFDYDDWHIVLGTLDNCFDLTELLEFEGGFGITHICKIQRKDNACFTLDEVYKRIEAFSYYLSFVRGIWIAPLMVCGFDSEGNQILEEWRNPTMLADSWQDGCRWTYVDSTSEIVAPFAGFMEKWQSSIWHETIKNAIQWYIESLKHFNGYNTSICSLQAALEKIAWVYLNVNDCMIAKDFKSLTASGQIRLLLKFIGIPKEELDEYEEIHKLAKEFNWEDTITAITEIRNTIIHPHVKRINNCRYFSEEVMQEAFSISHSYLLKSLLKLFDYPYSTDWD
ncbi:MAG: hypothetical protein AAF063_05835 [Cyanobacteria bacterium J06643_5]